MQENELTSNKSMLCGDVITLFCFKQQFDFLSNDEEN